MHPQTHARIETVRAAGLNLNLFTGFSTRVTAARRCCFDASAANASGTIKRAAHRDPACESAERLTAPALPCIPIFAKLFAAMESQC